MKKRRSSRKLSVPPEDSCDNRGKSASPSVEKLKVSPAQDILDFAVTLSEQKDLQEILRLVVHKAVNIFHGRNGIILLLNPISRDTLKTAYKKGEEDSTKLYRQVCTQVCGWVLAKKQPFLTGNLSKDSRFRENLFSDIPVHSVMAVPLRVEGIILGVFLIINNSQDGEFTETDLELFSRYSAIVAPYLRNVQELNRFFEAPLPQKVLLAKYRKLGLLGSGERFLKLLHSIEAAANCDVRVLLEGATGTGKELVARAIYHLSARSDKSFVAIDCGAIPEHLIESELFGHVKGAFTGADRDRSGLFMEANGGVLFMDEIASLSHEMQSRLMRVLQEKEVRPIGSNHAHPVDVRIISATSVPLEELMRDKRIRQDLYYRLMVYPIYVPTLDERREDVPQLAYHFLQKFSAQQHKKATIFHARILDYFKRRSWDGNIRELEHFVERLVTLTPPEKSTITPDVLPIELQKEIDTVLSESPGSGNHLPLHQSLAEFEADLIRQVLVESDWNQSRAARALGISEGTIRYKMEKFGIGKPV